MSELKIAVIGAGSTYTPELVDCFIKRYDEVKVKKIHLFDIDEYKLSIVTDFVKRMVSAKKTPIIIEKGISLTKALRGSDFVILQLRVEGLMARHRDESVPLKYGCIGQETTGAGGFACAIRTIPTVLNICKKIEKTCPGAWLINFTNPSGIITEAIYKYSPIKVIGLCNIPKFIKKKLSQVFLTDEEKIDFDYVGLNHLSWITGLRVKGEEKLKDLPPEVIKLANLPEFPINREIIKITGLIPSPYLRYYYHHDSILKEQLKEKETRAQKVMRIEKKLLELYSNKKLIEKPQELEERGGACYSEAAFSIISSIVNNTGERHIVNIPNKDKFSELSPDSIIETYAEFYSDSYKITEKEEMPPGIKGLIQSVKSYETLTVESAVKKSKKLALMALMAHPLIGQYDRASSLLEGLIKSNKFKLKN